MAKEFAVHGLCDVFYTLRGSLKGSGVHEEKWYGSAQEDASSAISPPPSPTATTRSGTPSSTISLIDLASPSQDIFLDVTRDTRDDTVMTFTSEQTERLNITPTQPGTRARSHISKSTSSSSATVRRASPKAQ